jgi:hypothetical protein
MRIASDNMAGSSGREYATAALPAPILVEGVARRDPLERDERPAAIAGPQRDTSLSVGCPASATIGPATIRNLSSIGSRDEQGIGHRTP